MLRVLVVCGECGGVLVGGGGLWWGCARRVEAAARAKGRMRPSGWMRGAVLLSIVATSVGVKPLLIRPRAPTLSSTAVIQGPVFVPPTTLSSAIHKTEGVQNANMLVLLVSCAALIAAGSIVMLVFASLATHRSIPLRNFVAAAVVACASILLEALVGNMRRASFVGRTISEVGQALAIAAAGWASFSVFWATGFGSLLDPGRKPVLNAGAVLGCTIAAAVYGRVRPTSRAQTAIPFASALVMLHLHLLITEADIEQLKLAPMALASAAITLGAVGLDLACQRAVHAPPSEPSARYLRHVRGTADMVIASLLVNVAWTFFTLFKWTGQEAPSWGFIAISAAISATEIGLRAAYAAVPAAAQGAREYYVGAAATSYRLLAYWLADLCAWRTLWPDAPYNTDDHWWKRLPEAEKAERLRRAFRKREKHFFSLIGAYSLWGATCAAGGRPIAATVAVAMVLVVVFKTAISSLFEEPLVMAGLVGLALGATLIALVVKVFGDEDEQLG